MTHYFLVTFDVRSTWDSLRLLISISIHIQWGKLFFLLLPCEIIGRIQSLLLLSEISFQLRMYNVKCKQITNWQINIRNIYPCYLKVLFVISHQNCSSLNSVFITELPKIYKYTAWSINTILDLRGHLRQLCRPPI